MRVNKMMIRRTLKLNIPAVIRYFQRGMGNLKCFCFCFTKLTNLTVLLCDCPVAHCVVHVHEISLVGVVGHSPIFTSQFRKLLRQGIR